MRRRAHVVDGVLQIQDAVLDGVADVILRVWCRRRDLLVRTSLGQLLVLNMDEFSGEQKRSQWLSPTSHPVSNELLP